MITDLDQTIKKLLIEELPIKNGEIDVKFEQPTREWSAKLAKPTVNFFLYDVRENNTLRQHQWQPVMDGNGRLADPAARKRTPFRVDCTYMLTTWATDPGDEHRLLTRCLLALFRHPILPEDRLVGGLQNPTFELQARLAAHDKLTNPAEVWSALDNELRPSVSYIVTLALDPWTAVTGPAVQSLTMRLGQSENPRRQELDGETAVTTTTNIIGGTLLKGAQPQSGIDVALKGTGFMETTDENGRYRFHGVPTGSYTLLAWTSRSKPQEKKITVPAGDYDVEL
ncbi:MAG: DUF4255 domain-containing protein [Chloroflexi bacterium]|nr:DUF4255 domain-containing protein [Chloroflexota bacterium]MBP7045947.1 DUF4255 domain-containing protein [Chloroflexota bacterium]